MAEERVTRRSLRDQAGRDAGRAGTPRPTPQRASGGTRATGATPAARGGSGRTPAAPPPPPSSRDRAGAGAKASAARRGSAANAAKGAAGRKGEKLPARPARWWRGLAILVLLGAIFFGVGAAVGLYLFGR